MLTKEQYIQSLQDIIRINSENGNEEEVALYLQNLLAQYDISSQLVKYAEHRSSLVAEIKNGEGSILGISGHMDVVAAGDESQWTYPPFSGEIVEDFMYGRGTTDMKSGLMALVFAMIRLKQSGNFKGTIRLLATVGEEVGEHGSHQLTQEGYARDLDALLIGEPVNLGIMYAHKGSYNYTIRSYGVAAHSSAPEVGVNAIEHLQQCINSVQERLARIIVDYQNPIMGNLIHNITLIKGGTQVNSIPDYAEYQANARTIPEFDNQQMTQLLTTIIDELNQKDGYRLELSVDADQPPVQAEKMSRLVRTIQTQLAKFEDLSFENIFEATVTQMKLSTKEQALVDHYHQHMPTTFEPIAVSGTTDAAQFTKDNRQMDVAVYGPGISPLAHQIDERVSISQYLRFIDLYEAIYEAYLQK